MAEESNVITGTVRTPRNLSAHVRGSIHDDATATALGFRGGTVAGSIHMDQFPPLLLEAFGPTWFETGSRSLYFRQATTDGEPVQAFLERPPAGDQAGRAARDAQVRAWMTATDGDLVAEGTASAGLVAGLRRSPGAGVGLFGAIEIRFAAGPVFTDRSYRVSGEVTALSETPETEVLWFDSRARGEEGALVAEMRMMLRQMKQSSPLYREQAASA